MMWWLLLVLALLAIALIVPLTRIFAARRERSRQWNDLRQRRQLIASQLRHLHDVTERRNGPAA
jgi:hypothetical protein